MTSPTATPAPVSLEQKYVEKLLANYNYTLEEFKNRSINYLTYKLLKLTESDDPKISLSAIEQLGKSDQCRLFQARVELSFDAETDEALRQKMSEILLRHAIDISDLN